MCVIGKIHSPGLVILRNSELDLVPIVGERRTLSLTDTKLVGEGRWLPGKYVWGKRAFTFNANASHPLAFAVAESVGARWSEVFRVYGLRLYRDDVLLFETTVCWQCQNFYVPRYDKENQRFTHGWYGFANDDNAKSLLKLFRSLLPHPKHSARKVLEQFLGGCFSAWTG